MKTVNLHDLIRCLEELWSPWRPAGSVFSCAHTTFKRLSATPLTLLCHVMLTGEVFATYTNEILWL